MDRYSPAKWGYRGIANYQVWNESNITTFWSGTTAQLAQLVKTAYDVRNAVDPGAKIVAPAMVARLGYQRSGIKAFYATKVAGVPVWKYVDAISLNLYPVDNGQRQPRHQPPDTPEDSMGLLGTVRGLWPRTRCRRAPDLEHRDQLRPARGVNGGTSAAPISDRPAGRLRDPHLPPECGAGRQAGRLVRLRHGQPARCRGGGPLGNTLLTDPGDRPAGTLTPAGWRSAGSSRG